MTSTDTQTKWPLRYINTTGATITVDEDGKVTKLNKAGKKVSTSATAAKLATGHGGWTLVEDEATAELFAAHADAAPAPTGRKVRKPMRFKQADAAEVSTYLDDPAWWMQQKLDGIRGQLVFTPGEAPWFRAATGTTAASSTAAKATVPILDRLPVTPADTPAFAVDGEILDAAFYVFDHITDGEERTPLAQRLDALAAWHAALTEAGLAASIHLLPTARTSEEKRSLVRAVRDAGAEGWIVKQHTSGYDYDERVEHSLKIKLTHTVDCLVIERDRGGVANFVLGLYDPDSGLVEVGSASAIGKPDAKPGDVVEVKYLYAGANGGLIQPTVLRLRSAEEKHGTDCTTEQLRFADKRVVSL